MGTEALPKSEEAVPAEAPSSLEQQIIRQIEYYFGNYNLSRDKFLREQLKVDDGWIPLETMVKFNRLKKLSDDFNVIVGALKKSPKQLMEVNEDCTKIRRRTADPVPEDYNKSHEELDKRTLYVKGFKRAVTTLDELLEFFKEYKVENVFMRKNNHLKDKPFKGSVFVTFEAREDAEKFFETKGIKYNGTELLREWKADYVKRKDEVYSKIKAEKEKKMLKREQEKAKEQEDCEKAAENDMVPGCLLKIINLNESNTREELKEMFEPLGTLLYVDYSKGKPSAVLRFEEGQAKSVLEKVLKENETVKIGSSEVTISVLEGDEEKEYWKTIAIWRAENKKRKGNNRGHRNFPNKKRKWTGNRQRGKKDEGDDGNDKDDETSEPPQKQAKVDKSEAANAKESTAMEVNSNASSEQNKNEAESQSES